MAAGGPLALSRLLQAEMQLIHAQQHQQLYCWKGALECLTTICQQETQMPGSESALAWSWQDAVMAAQVEAGRCSQMCGVRTSHCMLHVLYCSLKTSSAVFVLNGLGK